MISNLVALGLLTAKPAYLERAEAIPQAFASIGEMVCDDLVLLAAGLPPVRMQAAAPELVRS